LLLFQFNYFLINLSSTQSQPQADQRREANGHFVTN